MRRYFVLPLALALLIGQSAFAHDNGTHSMESKHSVDATMDKLEAMVKEKGFTIFTRVSHTAGAKKVGIPLRPTELLIFGNPKGGTVLMACNQLVGLDLPLKYLVWEDEKGKTWIGYNEASYLADRYKLGDCGAKVIKKVGGVLELMATVASK